MNDIDKKTFFVGIGAQKAGTTWLADYLSQHPEVSFSPIKELHYFSRKYLGKDFRDIFVKKISNSLKNIKSNRDNKSKINFHMNRIMRSVEVLCIEDDDDYKNYFKRHLNEDSKAFGEITPAYSMLDKNAFENIYELYPEVKFLFGMRSPVERFWSHLRYVKNFNPDFDPMIEFENRLQDKEFTLRTDYKRTITELESIVPKEKIFYYFYEDLFGETGDEVLRSLTEFLDLKYIAPDFSKSVNVSKRVEMPPEMRKMTQKEFEEVINFVKEKFRRVPENWILPT